MGLRSAKLIHAALLLFGLCGSLAAAPKLRLASTSFGPYSIASGTNGAPQTVEAYNAGDGALSLSAMPSVPWLLAFVGSPRTCQSVPGQSACLPIQFGFQTASLANGTYTGEVTVGDPNAIDAPQIVTVTVKIGGGIPDSLNLYVAPNGSSASATMSSNSFIPSFSTTTQDGRQWLSLAAGGAGSFSFGVTYTVTATHLSGMAEGAYSGSLGFSGSSFPGDNKNVQVNLHVTSAPIAEQPQPIKWRVVQNSAKQTWTLNVNNRGLGSLAVSGVTTAGGAWLSAGNPSTAITITADPTGLAPGVYTGSVTLTSNAVNNTMTVPVQLTVIPPSAPFTYFGGAVNHFTYRSSDRVAQGDIVAVFGEQLSDQQVHSAPANVLPLPTQLGPTRALVNGQPAPLWFASYGQVNIQIPFETQPGDAVVRIERDGQAGNGVSIQVSDRSPHLLAILGGYGYIQNYGQDLTYPAPPSTGASSRRAHVGDAFVIWVTGLGQTSPSVATGAGAPAVEPLARIPAPLKVHFGDRVLGVGVDADPFYVGMTGGLVGTYQVNVFVPPGTPKGDRVPLYLDLGSGRLSNSVLVAIE